MFPSITSSSSGVGASLEACGLIQVMPGSHQGHHSSYSLTPSHSGGAILLAPNSMRSRRLRVIASGSSRDGKGALSDSASSFSVNGVVHHAPQKRSSLTPSHWNWDVIAANTIKIAAGLALSIHFVWAVPSSEAVDALKTCACLLKECRIELARCIADPACAANVACLQTCNNRPDETQCQIGCGDIFENSVVDQFNDCAVSRKGCVPQKPDQGQYPVPSPTALVNRFDTLDFSGKWYISSGLNPTFDTFDCQLHEFSASPNKLTGKLTWRIKTPDGGFFTRSTVQNFVQDPNQPGILYNHDNEFLHYQDDWYILSAQTEQKPDDYVFVYYKGRNDAWDGYGGAVVYTRSKTLPESIIPKLTAAARNAGLDFKKFRSTDNTCGPEPPLFARLEKKVEEGEQALVQEVKEIEEEVVKVGKTEMNFLGRLGKGVEELNKDKDLLLRELGEEEKALLSDLKMEAEEVERLFGKALPLRKLR